MLDVDVAFPPCTAPFGEDGTIQGMLETLDVAYVGSGVSASAVCLDKVLFKELMSRRTCHRSTTLASAPIASRARAPRFLAEIGRLGLARVRQARALRLLDGHRQGERARPARGGSRRWRSLRMSS